MGMLQGNNGENSSKRIIGFIIIVWVMLCSTVYGTCILMGSKESNSIDNILISMGCAACAMITGGVIEKFGKK
jgi:uncharacterized membrane protein